MGAASIPAIAAAIASDKAYYIMPVFEQLPALGDSPPNTVIVNNREWAQPYNFTNATWNDINAVCPAANSGVCNYATLTGTDGSDPVDYDMTGWTWAGVEEINALFNAFGAPIGPGHDSVDVAGAGSWNAMTGAGFQPLTFAYMVAGMRDSIGSSGYLGQIERFNPSNPAEFSRWSTHVTTPKFTTAGGWFYRDVTP